jgi:3-oxoacyl-[acyl-carrier-protein] synthase III
LRFAAVTGWGIGVPQNVVTNAELALALPQIDPAWIERRSGIEQRHLAAAGESTSTFAVVAGAAALEVARIDPSALDLVIVATCTPDRQIPGIAPLVASMVGATGAGAFDVNAACAGFLTAYGTADAMIRSGRIHRALVIGAETMSRFVNWGDPKTCVLFGDGAGAVVLEATDEPAGLLSLTFGADGGGADLIQVPAGGSARPATAQTVEAKEHTITMNGPEVYRAAVRIMETAARDAIRGAGYSPGDIDLLIAHQANQRIIAEVGDRLGLDEQHVFSNVAHFGNTSAASIPIALSEAARQGRLHPGARFVLTAVGAGLTWAAGAGIWTGAPAGQVPRHLETIGANG